MCVKKLVLVLVGKSTKKSIIFFFISHFVHPFVASAESNTLTTAADSQPQCSTVAKTFNALSISTPMSATEMSGMNFPYNKLTGVFHLYFSSNFP